MKIVISTRKGKVTIGKKIYTASQYQYFYS